MPGRPDENVEAGDQLTVWCSKTSILKGFRKMNFSVIL